MPSSEFFFLAIKIGFLGGPGWWRKRRRPLLSDRRSSSFCVCVCLYVSVCACVSVCVDLYSSSFYLSVCVCAIQGFCAHIDSFINRECNLFIWSQLFLCRAGHFRYFFFNNKKWFVCICYYVNNLFPHQPYLKSPLPVKLTW